MADLLFVGTAGWSIPRASAFHTSGEGTHLERYARVFSCAEINSSFHRLHSATTYAKWAQSTPAHFRFAVKMPRAITHDQRLQSARAPLEQFLAQTAGLSTRRGPLLVQLPPSLAFDPEIADRFFDLARACYDGYLVCEPRHLTWLSSEADALLRRYHVARVAADPAPAPGAQTPAGWDGLRYYRLHGSPRKYWSRYDAVMLQTLAARLRAHQSSSEAWCIFDNTASGAAFENAWELRHAL